MSLSNSGDKPADEERLDESCKNSVDERLFAGIRRQHRHLGREIRIQQFSKYPVQQRCTAKAEALLKQMTVEEKNDDLRGIRNIALNGVELGYFAFSSLRADSRRPVTMT